MEYSQKFTNKYKKFISKGLQDELIAITENINMRAEISNCPGVKEFLELFVVKWRSASDYCNLCTALMLYLTLPITVASCERSFSKMKQIKNYLRNSMGTNRLKNLAIFSIESIATKEIANNLENIIERFADRKARRVNF